MWCARILFFFALTLVAATAFAGDPVEDSLAMPAFRSDGSPMDRWRIIGDFNLDGYEDLLLSEDITNANENGLYMAIYLRDSTGQLSFYDTIFDHPNRLCIEKCDKEVRVWTYEYIRSGIGMLSFAVVSEAGLVPGGHIELRESGRISMLLRNAPFSNSDARFKVQRSHVIAGKVQWVDDKQPLSLLPE